MLQEFLESNRTELIERCRAKVALRPGPRAPAKGMEHGHELLQHGYTVDQVVHDYGDMCQAVTELAIEREATVTADEFKTLNMCLDNAIAAAVSEYDRERDHLVLDSGN